jgi:cell division protein FtsL
MTLVRDRITAFASGHLIDLTGVDGQTLRGTAPRRDSRRDIALALDFAYGIDPAGRRLPLVADSLAPELLRRPTVARERDNPRWADVYAAADHFDDGRPNVIMLSDQHDAQVTAPTDLRDLSNGRSQSGPTASRSNTSRGATSRATTSRGETSRTSVPTPTQGQSNPSRPGRASAYRGDRASSGVTATGGRSQLLTRTDHTNSDDGFEVRGATALKIDRQSNERRSDVRFQLRLVGRQTKVTGGVGVVAFWTVFVVAMMFAAVVMWAQNTTRSIELENVNQKLAAAESSYTQLRVEVARLQSPQRIESEAARLGLSTPSNITFVAPDRSVAVSSAR